MFWHSFFSSPVRFFLLSRDVILSSKNGSRGKRREVIVAIESRKNKIS